MSAREYSQMPAAQLRRTSRESSARPFSTQNGRNSLRARSPVYPVQFNRGRWTAPFGGSRQARTTWQLPVFFLDRRKGPALQTMVDAIYDKVGASYICGGKYAAYHKVSKP